MTKSLSLIVLTLFLSISLAQSGEFTGQGVKAEDVLVQNHKDPSELVRTGHRILSGELTGIGKSVPLGKVTIFVLEKELVEVDDINALQVGSRTIPIQANSDLEELGNTPASEVRSMNAKRKIISSKLIKGLVYKTRN